MPNAKSLANDARKDHKRALARIRASLPPKWEMAYNDKLPATGGLTIQTEIARLPNEKWASRSHRHVYDSILFMPKHADLDVFSESFALAAAEWRETGDRERFLLRMSLQGWDGRQRQLTR